MPTPLAVVLLLLMLANRAAAESEALPLPTVPGAGERWAERVEQATDQEAARVLAQFDAWMKAHPTDASAAVERCRLLDRVAYDEEGFGVRLTEEAERCRDRLERAFAATLPYKAYAVERAWGDEALAAADRFFESGGKGSVHELRVRRSLVDKLRWGEDAKRAIPHARRAMELDPALDLAYELALAHRDAGEDVLALAVLRRGRETQDPARLAMEAKLLHDLGAHAESVARFERAEQREASVDQAAWAGSLEALGRIDEARTRHAAAIEQTADFAFGREELLVASLRFELAHGDPSTISTAYQTLRDEGFWSDPLARHRLDVWLAAPTAPWQARDLLGLLALLLAMVGVALLPLGFILPIHYVSLWRTVRDPSRVVLATPYSLRRAWLAFALLLLAQLGAVYLFAPDDVFTLFAEDGFEAAGEDVDEAGFARLGLLLSLATGLAALVAGRGRLRRLFAPGSWGLGRSIRSAVGGLVLLWPLAALLGSLSEAVGAVLATTPATSLTELIIRSVYHTYGGAVLLADVAIVTPLAEETLFRGVLLGGIGRHLGFGWANFLQASLFAAIHEEIALAPFFLALGLVAGRLTHRSGSLRSAVILHALNNALACLAVMRLGPGAG
ncbi:MAG: type II CAAX endopeptidase family protein [Myxococcota bacterium]